jgi:alkylated DNA repair protein alkB family protein 7
MIWSFYLLKMMVFQLVRRITARRARQQLASSSSLINWNRAAPELDQSLLHVWTDVITEEEEERLKDELVATLRRRRYSQNHWDAVIVKFRETERAWGSWEDDNRETLARMRSIVSEAIPDGASVNRFLGAAHVLDVAADGYILPHVDSVKASGTLIAGLSLLSDCDMTLRYRPGMSAGDGWEQELDTDSVVEVKLPRCVLFSFDHIT